MPQSLRHADSKPFVCAAQIIYRSLPLARPGDGKGGVGAQEQARPEPPDELTRFATHLELHRSLRLVRPGGRSGGVAYAEAASAALPPGKHSLTLRMLMKEIKMP